MTLYAASCIIIVAAMVFYVIWYYYRKRKKESANDQIGAAGERLVASRLKKEADRYGWTVLNNVYLPLYDKTTQIDHLVIGDFGVLVVETKNVSGSVYGDASSKEWRQMIGKKQNTLYNPLLQNKAHIDCLNHHLRKAGLKNISVHGLVLFAASDVFLNIPKSLPVITLDRLGKFLAQSAFHVRSMADTKQITEAIEKVRITDSSIIRKHNKQVKEMAASHK